MKTMREYIADYLEKLESSSPDAEEELAILLGRLANHIVFTPVTLFTDLSDEVGTKKIKVATLEEGGKKFVPTFTSDELFFEWSEDRYQCLSVPGADLALSLPDDTGVVIDLGTTAALELSPAELAQVARAGEQSVEEEEVQDGESSDQPGVSEGLDHFDPVSQEDVSSLSEQSDSESAVPRLLGLLRSYDEISEGYFATHNGGRRGGALGLLAGGLSPERRFLLMADIAEVSREVFGLAGAIEVYDDLNETSATSWSHFSGHPPFYVREDRGADVLAEPAETAAEVEDKDSSFFAAAEALFEKSPAKVAEEEETPKKEESADPFLSMAAEEVEDPFSMGETMPEPEEESEGSSDRLSASNVLKRKRSRFLGAFRKK